LYKKVRLMANVQIKARCIFCMTISETVFA